MWLPVHVVLLVVTGTVVSQSSDLCTSSPCLNEGSCIAAGSSFYCFCQPGYYGHTCEVSLCTEMQKATGGVDICSLYNPSASCVGDILNATFCECPPAFRGLFCDEDYTGHDNTTLCQRQKELYAYAMNLLNSSYTSDFVINTLRQNFDLKSALKKIGFTELPITNCTSNGMFAAVQCHVDLDDISHKTCFCADSKDGTIRPGYHETAHMPTNCQDTPCTVCENGGSCVNGKCQCTSWYYGDRCQHRSSTDLCTSSPCLNEGSCIAAGSSFYCFCQPGYYGHTCEVSLCTEMQQATGGVDICSLYNPSASCVGDILNATFCECPPAFRGLFCNEAYTGHDNTTLCQRQKELYAYAMNLLNSSYTSDFVITTLRQTFDLKSALKKIGFTELPITNCTSNGMFAAVQCHVDLDDISHKTCFCADSKDGTIRPGYHETAHMPTNCQDKYIKHGKCPQMSTKGVGICVEECSYDMQCKGDKKCCSNGCGHICMKPQSEYAQVINNLVVKLNMQWKDSYAVNSSYQYKQLIKNITEALNKKFTEIGNFSTVTNICVKQGSVVIKFEAMFKSKLSSKSKIKILSVVADMNVFGLTVGGVHYSAASAPSCPVCENGGSCVNGKCQCTSWYYGDRCQHRSSTDQNCFYTYPCKYGPCTTVIECKNGGTCFNGTCICTSSYHGDRCQHVSNKTGTCPNITGVSEDCRHQCSSDKNCTGSMKCCSNGCGHLCMFPVKMHNPCEGHVCPSGTECRPQNVQCITAPCNPIPVCVATCPVCENGGSCYNGKCQCFGSYYGDRCQNTIPCPVCENGGTCIEGKCQCFGLYYGDRCQHSSSMPCIYTYACKNGLCTTSYTCENGGSCLDNGTCMCFSSYYGDRCEHSTLTNKTGNCPNITGVSEDCRHQCSSDINCTGSMKCCSNGCGHLCLFPVKMHDPCEGHVCPSGTECRPQNVQCITAPCNPIAVCVATCPVCENGGSCYNGKCHCFGSYYGDRCQHSSSMPCIYTYACKNGLCTTSYTCENGGSCLDNGTCMCFSSYYGDRCEHSTLTNKTGNCPNVTGVSEDCRHQCSSDINCTGSMKCCSNGCGHLCLFPVKMHDPCEGHVCPSGTECRPQNVQCITAPCNPIPVCVATCPVCENGGSCYNGKCQCFGSYYGDRCQNSICNPGYSVCTNTYRCIADSLRCNGVDDCGDYSDEMNCTKECPMPCMNYGTCMNGKCHCYSIYYGERCEHTIYDKSACQSDLECYNGGQCLKGQCFCNPSYYGYACLMKNQTYDAISCDVTLCSNGGTCSFNKCYCASGFFGRTCQFSVHEDLDTYRKFRSDLKINMPWKESYREMSDHPELKIILENMLIQTFSSDPTFDKVEVTGFRQGSVVASYTAHFTDVIDQESAMLAAQQLDDIVMNVAGVSYTILPHDDCRSSAYRCFHGQCQKALNGTYECVCIPTYYGTRCKDNACSNYTCKNGFNCFVTQWGEPACNCSYKYGKHCEDVPCGCNPHTERCIFKDFCNEGQCYPRQTCVAMNYTGPCDQGKCIYGDCVETQSGGSYCKCYDSYTGSTCAVKKSVCDLLPVDICSEHGGQCVGEVMDGKLCSCPYGKRGAFCEVDGYAVTECQRKSDLFRTALGILNGSITVPHIANASDIIKLMFKQILHLDSIPFFECMENGDFAPKQCNVNIYNMNKSNCYCVNSEGMMLTSSVPHPMGYPPCTGPPMTQVSQALCGSQYADLICLNGGSCLGDILSSHPRLCLCQEGYTGAFCQRKLGINEEAENFTRCRFSEDTFNMLHDIIKGKFQFNITVNGVTITLDGPLLFNFFQMMRASQTIPQKFMPTTVPYTTPTTPYWNEGDYSTQWNPTNYGTQTDTNPPTSTTPTTPFWDNYGDGETTETYSTGWTTRPTTAPTTIPPWVTDPKGYTPTTAIPGTSSGNQSTSQFFLERVTCTSDGEFQPLQCTYNIHTGQHGHCYCVDKMGSMISGTIKPYSQGLNHCKDETPDECPKLKCLIPCEHGYLQDLKGCDICMCRKPCDGKICSTGHRCVNETSYDRRRCHGKYSCQVPLCRKMHKSGVCPANAIATMQSLRKMFQDSYHTCDITCHDDADCEGNLKCCGACGNKCVKPFAPETCFEKKEIMDVHWALYLNMTEYLKDDNNVKMANSTYPHVLKGAISWLDHMHVMWIPSCTPDGDYQRVQCEYNVKTKQKVKCFCVNDDGLRVNRTDVLPPKYPVCETKPGMCPPVAPNMVGICIQECENDFSCSGTQKCCSNNCGNVCKKPLNFTAPFIANNVNAMLLLVCQKQNVCQSGHCTPDWMKGKLCMCRKGWTGVTCNQRITVVEKLSRCEKRKALYQWIRNNTEKVYMAIGDEFDDLLFTIMQADCMEDGKHFKPMQCDHDIMSGRTKWCYCVDENGFPINGTEVDHPHKPTCGDMHCPYGNPLMTTKSFDHFGCSTDRPCPQGYMCNSMAYGKRVCCPSEHGMKDICNMTYNPGQPCNESTGIAQQSRFYYNYYDGLCHMFTYLGCSGNKNNFYSKEACEKRCHRKEKSGKCPKVVTNVGLLGHCRHLCVDDGDCEGDRKCCMTSCGKKCLLPFNNTASVCKNGFPLHKANGDQFVCTRMRQCPAGYTCHVPPADGPGHCCAQEDKPLDVCHQPSDTGPCKALMKRFFFDTLTQQCKQFNYGGCQGNENNFKSHEECCNSCGGNTTRCKIGTCPKPSNYLTTCWSTCKGDADCSGKEICCYNGCGMKCTASTASANKLYHCFDNLEMAYHMMDVKTVACNIVTIPRCNDDGSWKKQQCTDALGVCWCVDKHGKEIPSSRTRGVANCMDTPDFLPENATQANNSKFQVCPSDKPVHCCNPNVCHMKTCPANPSAVCRVNPCGSCNVEFLDHNNNVVDCSKGLSKCHEQHHTSNMYRLQHAVNTMSDYPMPGMNSSSVSSSPMKEKLPSFCRLPPYTGRCRAYMPAWFYNATSMRCEKFIYGGCNSNGNNFKTPAACYDACSEKSNPCQLVKCMDGETCKLEENEQCDKGPCDHWPICNALFSEFHIGGVYLPVCTRDRYALRQCHHGYCWCVSPEGSPIENTLSKGHSLVCYNDGTYVLHQEHEVGRCSDGSMPRLHCLEACKTKVCPGHHRATCFVNMCDDKCATKFVENGNKVSCTDDVCSLISAQPNNLCPSKKLCPDGQIPPMCDPRSCSSESCPNNPCAVCTIDPCSCQVQFVDLLTKKIEEDCSIVTHTLCEIETCQKYSDKAREKLLQGYSDIALPVCTEGNFEPKQCIGEYCWCVDGFGRKTKDLLEDEPCIRNETVSVTVQIKFNQPFSSIKGRHAEFEKALRETLDKLSLGDMLQSVEFVEGSIDCIMKFVDKNEMSLHLALVPDILIRKVRNNELAVQWDGEQWTADKEEILVNAEFEAQIQEPEEPEEPEHRRGLDKNVVIVLGVVGGAVGLFIIAGLVYFCCCRRRQSNPQTSNEDLYQSTIKQPQATFAASNALYGSAPLCEKSEINYMPYVVEDSQFIKEKL